MKMESGEDKEEIRLLMKEEDGDGGSGFVDSSCSPSAAAAAAVAAPSSLCLCRICHEEEEEGSTTMESPCACSGTLKFAHRECIQRWCDEKGSNICEICLQKYEPGYTIHESKALVDVGVTIRGSLEVPRINYDPENPEFVTDSDSDSEYGEAPASRRRASCCRLFALMFMILLLIRNLVAVITVDGDHYAFTIMTVFLLRASGILLPFYFVMRFVSAFQEAQRQDQLEQLHMEGTLSGHRSEVDDEHRIQISS